VTVSAFDTTKTAAAQNPTTITAALGIILSGVGALMGWSAETQAAIGQITLGTALLARLTVLAWKDARTPPPAAGA
jgi:hypothetical protein